MRDPRHETSPPLALLLLDLARTWDERGQREVNRLLGERVARPALMRLLPALEAGPVRVSALARRADVSKQAVTQALRACERRGLVTYRVDPDDGRARLVMLTDAGREAVRLGRGVLRRIERRLARQVGAELLVRLRRDLSTVRRALDADPDRPPRSVA